MTRKRRIDCRTESAHLHVVYGVRSCYAIKPSALQKSDEPKWQSRKQSSLDDTYPSTTPDMVDVAAHLAVQPSVKLCTTQQSLRTPRVCRQHAPTTAAHSDASNSHAGSSSMMSKSRENTHRMHKSAMSPPALAGRLIHRLIRRDESHRTRYPPRAHDELEQLGTTRQAQQTLRVSAKC